MSMCVYMSVMCLCIEPRILPSVEDGADGLPRAASTDFGSMSGPLCANTGHQSECFAVPACDP